MTYVVRYSQTMIKIKQFLNKFSVSFFLLVIVLSGELFVGVANAVEPGCYASSASNSSTKNISSTACPAEKQSLVDQNQACFVTSVSSGGQTDFSETDCSSIVLGNSDLVESTSSTSPKETIKVDLGSEGDYYCGKGDKQVKISFDIGCLGNDYSGSQYNPVLDMLFALLRFVTAGVGIVVTGSIIWAGIQYSISRGDPHGTEAALKRISNAVIALLMYIFAFAILNFLVPGGLFR